VNRTLDPRSWSRPIGAAGINASTGKRAREVEMRKLKAALVPLFVAAAIAVGAPNASSAAVTVSVAIAPPVLPVYDQPPIPGPGYIWTPGYWAWGAYGYYWVPGIWALPPAVGLLWTPPYWGWSPGGFAFHAGFWGPTVGFYGGINYGFGYFGVGFAGGYWSNGNFFYNRAVTNIGNVRITNVYNRSVTVNRATNFAFNGGPGGTTARPTAAELAAAQERHLAPTAAQVRHQQLAGTNRALRASVNHGNPSVAGTRRPGEFTGHGVVAAHGAVPPRAAVHAGHRPAALTGAGERATPHAPQGRIEQRRAPQERAAQRAGREHAFERSAPHASAARPRAARQPLFERRASQARAAPPHQRAPEQRAAAHVSAHSSGARHPHG
jgi:hypothetical protein